MSLSLDCGGHLTHGHNVSISGKRFQVTHYHVNRETYLLDYDEIMEVAKREKPKLIIAGYSAYPRSIDFGKLREIADEVGGYLIALHIMQD